MKSILTLFAALFCFVLISGASAQSIGVIPPCTPAPIGLAEWWTADGNTFGVRNRNNGILTGSATYDVGQNGQAFLLDGIDDYVLIPQNATHDVGTGDGFTLEAWINPNATDTNPIFEWSNATYGVHFWLGLGCNPLCGGMPGGLYANLVDTSNVSHQMGTTTSVVPLNQWTHVALTYDKISGDAVIYVNGAAVQTTNLGTFTPRTNLPLNLGARPIPDPGCSGNGCFFGRLMEEEGIYYYALSAPQIAVIANAGSGGKCKPTATTAPTGMVGWWGGDGDANDFSGSGNNGTLQNGAGFAIGKVGQALSFNGVDGFMSTPSTPLTATNNWTMETWINPANLSQQGMVMSNGFDNGASGNGYSFGIGNGCTVSGSCGPGNKLQGLFGGVVFLDGGFTFPAANQWYHVAMVRDAGTVKFYVNGIQTPSTSTATPLTPTQFRIGSQAGIRFFNGLVDEPSLYNRALTDAEITSIFNAGLAGKLKTVPTPTDFPVFARNKTFTAASPQVINVTVGDATVTFPSVTVAGTTQEIPLSLTGLPALPLSATSTGLTYDIATSAVYTGSPTVCFNLPSLTMEFGFLRILHLESGVWVNRTNTASMSPNLCSTALPSLSPFAIVRGLSPNAATVSVSGRVSDANGFPVSRAAVTLIDTQGNTRRAITNPFGYYRFDDVEVGQTYVFNVSSKRYQFAPQAIFITEDVVELDFTAQ